MYLFRTLEIPLSPFPIKREREQGVLIYFGTRQGRYVLQVVVIKSWEDSVLLSSHTWKEKLNELGASMGLAVYDLELPQGKAGTFRVFLWQVDPAQRKEGTASLEQCIEFAKLMRTLPELRALEASGAGLEVSSPGVNRALRTPEHFQAAVGEHVAVKVFLPEGGAKKVRGELEEFCGETNRLQILLDSEHEQAKGKASNKKKNTQAEKEREVFSFLLTDVVEAKVEYVFRSNRK